MQYRRYLSVSGLAVIAVSVLLFFMPCRIDARIYSVVFSRSAWRWQDVTERQQI